MPTGSLRDLDRPQRLTLVAATLLGAAIRIAYQDGRPFTGDEAGTLLCIAHDYGYLLTHFDTWLSMNAYLVMTKALAAASGQNPWVMVAPSLVAGVAAIPVTAAVGVRLATPRTATIAAVLVAANPFLVFYGVQLRSYMAFTTACLVALVCFLDWRDRGRRGAGVGGAIAMLLAALLHANALYFAAFLGVLFLRWLAATPAGTARRRAAAALLVPGTVAAALAVAAYLPVLAPQRRDAAFWSDVPPTSVAYVPYVAGMWFGRGFLMLPSVALLAWGTWTAAHRRPGLAALALAVVVPMALASFAGVSHYPWAFGRFFVFALPLVLLLLAEGVGAVAGRSTAAVAVVVALVLATWTPDARALFAAKRDRPWRTIARFLRGHLRPADLLLASDTAEVFPALNLGVYLGERAAAFRPVADFLAPAEAARPGRIVFVEPWEPLATTRPRRRFGTVQVVTYAAPTRAAAAAALLADLEARLGDRVGDALAGDWRVVLDVRAALGRPDADGGVTQRYYESLMRTRRQRYMPRQFLGLSRDRP